jgi:hypothetical protein
MMVRLALTMMLMTMHMRTSMGLESNRLREMKGTASVKTMARR